MSFVEKRGVVYSLMMVVLICVGVFGMYQIVMIHHAQFEGNQIHTKTLTILHTWEEGGQYYFSDELGCVYLIACKGDFRPKGEIRYDDMPKIRFDKLEEGHRYHVEYVLRQTHHVEHVLKEGYVRVSLSEKEMER